MSAYYVTVLVMVFWASVIQIPVIVFANMPIMVLMIAQNVLRVIMGTQVANLVMNASMVELS